MKDEWEETRQCKKSRAEERRGGGGVVKVACFFSLLVGFVFGQLNCETSDNFIGQVRVCAIGQSEQKRIANSEEQF